MFRRYEVGSETKYSLSDVIALGYSFLLAGVAMVVSLNVVEVGLSVWELILG